MALPRIILDRPDRPYELKWNDRAEARLGSLDRPPVIADLAHRNGRKAFYALCAFLWASITERGHRFAEPEDLAQYLSTADAQLAAFDAINAMFAEAYPMDEAEKKSAALASGSAKSVAPSAPASGPSASATSA